MKHKLNRLTALLLAVVMTFSMLLIPVEAASFTDVSGKAWYKSAVDFVSEKGFMAGVSETRFAPEENVTRAMFVTVLARFAGVEVKNDTTVFTDVRRDKWYTGAVTWAAQNGLVSGVGDGRFAPNAEITRQDLCAILRKFLSAEDVSLTLGEGAAFTDAQRVSSYAREAVRYCAQAGLITGFKDGSFRPKETATRAQVAAILMKLYKLSGGIAPRPAQTFQSEGDASMSVTVNAPAGALPENASMTVSRITDEAELAELAAKVSGDVVAAADVSFSRDGAELEPRTEVEVQIALDGVENLKNPAVAHIRDDGTVEYLSAEVVSLSRAAEGKVLRFYAQSFSVYVVVEGDETTPSYVTFEFYGRKQVNGNAVAGPSANEADWEKINTQKVRIDGAGTGFARQLYDPGVPTIAPTQLFDGWSVDKRDFALTDEAQTVGELNAELNRGNYNAGQTVKVYAMVYEVVRVRFFNQSNMLVWSESVRRVQSGDKQKADVTMYGAMQPLVSSMEFLGWTERENVESAGEMPTYDPDPPTLYDANTTYTFEDVTGTEALEFYPYVKAGHWLYFDVNVENNNKRNGFDDPTPSTLVSPIFVAEGRTPTQPEAPTRAGYVFAGWYRDPDCNVPVDFNEPLLAKTTFYAKWDFGTTTYSVMVYQQRETDTDFTSWRPYIDDTLYHTTVSVPTGSYVYPTADKAAEGAAAGLSGTVPMRVDDSTKDLSTLGGTPTSKMGYYFKYDPAHTTQSVRAYGDGSGFLAVRYVRRIITIGFFNWNINQRLKSIVVDYDANGNPIYGYPKFARYSLDNSLGGTGHANHILWSSDEKYLDDEKYDYIPASSAQLWYNSNGSGVDSTQLRMLTDPVKILQGLYMAPFNSSEVPEVPKDQNPNVDTWGTRSVTNSVGMYWADGKIQNFSVKTPFKDRQTTQIWSPVLSQPKGRIDARFYTMILPPYSLNGNGEERRLTTQELEKLYVENASDNTYVANGWMNIGGARKSNPSNRVSVTGNEFEGFRIHNYRKDGTTPLYSYKFYHTASSGESYGPYTITPEYDYSSENGKPSNQAPMWVMCPSTASDAAYSLDTANGIKGAIFVLSNFDIYYERARFEIKFWDKDQAGTILDRKLYYERDLNVLLDSSKDPDAASKLNSLASHDGFYFDGWFTDPEFTQPFSFDQTMPAHDVEVYSKWTPIRYRVLIDYTGGDSDAWIVYPDGTDTGATFVFDHGEVIPTQDFLSFARRPDDDGFPYTFAGWFLDSSFTTPYNAKEPISDNMVFGDDLYYGDPNGAESDSDFLARMASDSRIGVDPVNSYVSYDDRWTDRSEFSCSIRRVIRLYAKWNKELPDGSSVHVKYWGNHDLKDDQGAFDATGTGTSREHEWVDPDEYVIGSWTQGQAASVPVTPATVNDPERRFLYWEHVKGDRESTFKPTAGKDYVYPGQRFQVLESDLSLVEKDREDPYPYCKHKQDGYTAELHAAVPATCTEPGLPAYYTCSKCGRKFGDANLSEPVEIIPALGHNWANQTYTWSVEEGKDWIAGKDAMPTCTATATCNQCGESLSENGKVTATETLAPTVSAEGEGVFYVSFVNTDAFPAENAPSRTYKIPQLTIVDVTYYYSDARSETVTVDAGDVPLRGSSVPDGFTVPYGYELVGWAESRVASTTNAPAYTPAGDTKHITNNASLYAVYRATTTDRGEKFVPVTGTETGGRFVITSGNGSNLVALRSLYTDGLYSDSELGGAVSYTASGLHLGSGYLSNVGSGLVFTLSGGKLTGAGSKQLSTANGLSMAASGATWTVSANEVASGSSKLAYSGNVFTTASSASGIYVWKASGEQDVEYTYAYAPTALTTFDVTCNGTKVGTANAGAAIELPQPTVPSGKTFLGWVIGSYSEQASMPEGNVYYAGTKLTSGMTLTALYRYNVDTCELSSNVTVGTGDEYYITSGTSGNVYILGAGDTCSTTTITNGRPNASDANKVVLTNESGRVQIKNVSTGNYLYFNSGVYSFQYTSSASGSTGFKSVSNNGTATRFLYWTSSKGANYYLFFNSNNTLYYSQDGSVYVWKVVKGTRYATDASTTFSAAADHATRGVKSGASALRGSDSFAFQTGNRMLPERLGVESFRSKDKKETGFGESSLTRQDAPAVRAPVNTAPRGDGTPVYQMASGFSTYKDYLIVLLWGGRTYLLTHECTNGVIAPKLVPVDVNADGTITGSYDNYLFKATMESNYPGFVLESMENNTETFQYLMANGLDVKLGANDSDADMLYWNYDGNAHLLYNTRIDRDENYLYMNFASKIAEMKAMNMATETYVFERVDGRYTVTLYYYDSSSGEPVEDSLAFSVPAGATLDAASVDSLTIYNDGGRSDEEQAEFEAKVKGFLKNGAPEFNFGTDLYRFSRWEMSDGGTYLGNEVTANAYLIADYEQNPDMDFGKWVPYTPSKIDPALDYLVVLEGDHSKGQPDVALCSFNPYGMYFGEGADIATATTEYVTAYTGQVAYDENGKIEGIRTDGYGNPYNWTQDMIAWNAPEDVPQAGDKILIQKMPSSPLYYAWNFSKPTGGEMTCDNYQARNSKFILEHVILGNGYQVEWAALTLKDDPADLSEWTYDAQQHSLSTNRRSLYLGFNFAISVFEQRVGVFDFADRYYGLCTWVEKENARAAVKLYVRENEAPNNTVTVTFHNGNETETQVVYVNDPTELFPNRFEKEGYTFMSWNTDPNGNGTVYGDEEQIRIQSNLDLYAQWQEIRTNAQRWEETAVIEEGKDYLIGVEINGKTYLLVNKNEFSTQPYSFYDHDAVHEYEFGYLAPAIMSETETGIVTGVSGDAAQDLYYCRWNFHGSSGKYLISSGSDSSYFLTLGGDADWYGVFPSKRGDYWTYSDNKLFVAFEDASNHYLAAVNALGGAWSSASTGSAAHETRALTAADGPYAGSDETGNYQVKLYQRASEGATWDVRFVNTDGVTLRPGQWVADGETAILPEDPSMEDYYFSGWFLKGATEYFDFDTPITGDTVLEARFVPKKDIGYYVNLRAVYIQFDTEHTKIRWFGNNDPTGETGGDLYLSQKDVTDSTSGNTVHSVTFDLDEKTGIPVPTPAYNNGLSSTEEHPIYDNGNVDHLADMTSDPSGLYYDDYEFVGWSLQPTGPGMTGDAHPDLNEDNLTLKWVPEHVDSETGELIPGTFLYNKNYDNPDAEPEWVNATEVASDSSLMTNAFYAVWRPKYYYVYHSATGDLERREIQYVDDKGNDTNSYTDGSKIKPVDLVESTAPGTRYGGYYKTYGGVNTEYVDEAKKVGTLSAGWMPGEAELHNLINALVNPSLSDAQRDTLATALTPEQRAALVLALGNPNELTGEQLRNLSDESIKNIVAALTDEQKNSLATRAGTSEWIFAPDAMQSQVTRDLLKKLSNPDDPTEISTLVGNLNSNENADARHALCDVLAAVGVENPSSVTVETLESLTPAQMKTLMALTNEGVNAVMRTADSDPLNGKNAEFKDYDGYMKYDKDEDGTLETAYWTKKQAYSVSGLEDPEAIADVYGETMRPTAGTVYYLKEVPEAYLASKLFFVYKNGIEGNENEDGDGGLENVTFKNLHMVSVVDDNYYSRIGYEVKTVNPESGEQGSYVFYQGTLAKSFKIAKQNGTNYTSAVTVNSGSYEDLNVNQGYVAVVTWKEDPMTRAFYCEPMWTTLDGVDVIATENERYVDMDDPVATLSTELTLDLHNVTMDGADETSDWVADGYDFKVRVISRDEKETRWLNVDENGVVVIPDRGTIFTTMQIVRYATANAAAFTGNKGNMSKVDGKTVLFDIDFTAKNVVNIVVYPKDHSDNEGTPPTMQ